MLEHHHPIRALSKSAPQALRCRIGNNCDQDRFGAGDADGTDASGLWLRLDDDDVRALVGKDQLVEVGDACNDCHRAVCLEHAEQAASNTAARGEDRNGHLSHGQRLKSAAGVKGPRPRVRAMETRYSSPLSPILADWLVRGMEEGQNRFLNPPDGGLRLSGERAIP